MSGRAVAFQRKIYSLYSFIHLKTINLIIMRIQLSIRNFLILLTFSFGLLACESDGEKAMESTEDAVENAANDIADAFRSDKEEMKAEIKRAREDVNEEIQELESDLKAASGDAKVEIQNEINQLKSWSSDLEDKMKNLGSIAKEGWNDFKTNVNGTLEKVDQEISGEDE